MKVIQCLKGYWNKQCISVSLSGEYMDATLSMGMSWKDPRLRWEPSKFRNIHKIQLNPSGLWTPELEFVNRIHDYSYQDEKIHQAKVFSDGSVSWNR